MRLLGLLALLLVALSAAAQGDPAPPTDGVVVLPQLIGGLESVRPVYPEQERRDGTEGRVVLEFVVGANGAVESVAVVQSATPGLDAAALGAVRNARFRPGTRNGEPAPMHVSIPVNFRLMGSGNPFYARSELSLRAAPDGNAAVQTRLPPGTRVGYPTCTDGWCATIYGGFTGYVVEAGLTRDAPGGPPPRSTPVLYSELSGLPVHTTVGGPPKDDGPAPAGPDTRYTTTDTPLLGDRRPDAAVLTRIPTGAPVEAPFCSDGWCVVSYGRFTGYVAEAGLSAAPPR